MNNNLTQLCDIDRQLLIYLEKDEINAEEIVVLVDKREQLLAETFKQIAETPELIDKQQWQEAISRTTKVVTLMQKRTSEIAEHLKKYRHGNKSVQVYKKFL
ncbi:flagellar protein FliT [Vibrio sp. SCSIO 43136]|uniref:flagellar protein FliT n=1 Tax=Vibrio sp. SCSIO 43136 TaxID=2819101 RepID=UPI00207578BF|nr:flagellar protein FliT [Vibrio sp. SCSIO 43136]USD65968.1 flagellar protein FliT [Vibrio sp. SCSIO 43136]